MLRAKATVLFTIASLAVIGCTKFQIAKDLKAAEGAKSTNKATVQADFDLLLTKFGEPYRAFEKNKVNLRVDGANPSGAVEYKFNSGDNTSFRILLTSAKTTGGFCSVEKMKPTFRKASDDESESKDIVTLKNEMLEPNTDYILKVEVQSKECRDLNQDISILVWAGTLPAAEPTVSISCETASDGGSGAVFFPRLAEAYAYLNDGKKSELFGDKSFCEQPTSNRLSSGVLYGTSEWGVERVNFSAKMNGQDLEGSANFDSSRSSVTVECLDAQGKSTYKKQFAACTKTVLDLNEYQK